MPPKNMIAVAPGADFLAMPLPKKQKASSRPTQVPPLASTRKRMDLPVWAASSMPMGTMMPWLMALLRKSTCAGWTKMEVKGRRLWLTSHCTPTMSTERIAENTGSTIR